VTALASSAPAFDARVESVDYDAAAARAAVQAHATNWCWR